MCLPAAPPAPRSASSRTSTAGRCRLPSICSRIRLTWPCCGSPPRFRPRWWCFRSAGRRGPRSRACAPSATRRCGLRPGCRGNSLSTVSPPPPAMTSWPCAARRRRWVSAVRRSGTRSWARLSAWSRASPAEIPASGWAVPPSACRRRSSGTFARSCGFPPAAPTAAWTRSPRSTSTTTTAGSTRPASCWPALPTATSCRWSRSPAVASPRCCKPGWPRACGTGRW